MARVVKISSTTKGNLDYLRETLYHAKRAKVFLSDSNTIVGIKTRVTGDPESDFVNGRGERVMSIDKEVGSDLTGLDFCIERLECFIKQADKRNQG